ncbi:cortical protein marker for cell polarity-domain-containing protein [Schizophyllum commune]
MSTTSPRLLALLLALHVSPSLAGVPLVDFERMGTVGLAGAFAGLSVFDDAPTYDEDAATLLSRSSDDGSLNRLGSTNEGGRISAGCALGDTFYFGGEFSSIEDVSASNVASYSGNSFSSLGDGGPDGAVDAVYCDEDNNRVWFGGSFTSPGRGVAIWDAGSNSWSQAPFNGLTGADAHVYSITTNSSKSSLFFAGSFIASFGGNGTSTPGTNNPNVPYSAGATPYSSSLVPVPLNNAEVGGSPSSTNSDYGDINAILCPAGDDGAGNTWLAADGNSALVTIRKYSSLSASGVRLGNTFLQGRGTTAFSVTTIPDNTVQTLQYLDPSDNTNKTCSDTCPLSTDSSVLYQDFLFASGPQSITGVQITLSEWQGASAGLHILQILSSGAFASAAEDDNGQSCYAPGSSNSTSTGNWYAKVANTDISGTTQTVMVSDVDVGTSSSSGPSFTWDLYVSASGEYNMNLLVPGCTNFQNCDARTSVKVVVFPGPGMDPSVTTVSQTNTDDKQELIYSGPIVPSTDDFHTTVTLSLADSPEGNGANGQYELVADRVQLVLTSANITDDGSGSGNGTGSRGTKRSFGFLEWPLDDSTTGDATSTLDNSTETAADNLGFGIYSGVGGGSALTGSSDDAVVAVAHHADGIFVGGNFTLSSGNASGSANIVGFKNGALVGLSNNGVDGPVRALQLNGDQLYVGGSFRKNNNGGSTLNGIALYNVKDDTWTALGGGVDGTVTGLGIANDELVLVGDFTKLYPTSGSDSAINAPGLATWDLQNGGWTNSGGLVVGSMTLVANGTDDSSHICAGNIAALQKYGATGMVMLKNGDENGPSVTPLGVQLSDDGSSSSSSSSSSATKRYISQIKAHKKASSWLSKNPLHHLLRRQSSSLDPLPTPPAAAAPAVLAGVFWTNSSSSKEVAIIGGNFSFSDGSSSSQAIAIYDPESTTISALQGGQIDGTVRALLVDGDTLYIGGDFTLSDTDINGFAIYDLATQSFHTKGQSPQSSSGSSGSVRSITKSSSKDNTIIAAGSFAKMGSLTCAGICMLDTESKQWNALGNGIQGEVASVAYGGDNQAVLIAGGSIAVDNNAVNVAQFVFENNTWTALGDGSLPGVVTAVEVNNGNSSSVFAAGVGSGSSTFLYFWNGASWSSVGSNLQDSESVAQLTMVPLQDTHDANGVIEPDRMLMVSGSLALTDYGNTSSALFDGQAFVPYLVSSSSTGSQGIVAGLFRSLSTFDFTQHKFLAVGVVILISIAIAAGVVFLLALIGILWTLFSRRDDKVPASEIDEDDDGDSIHHRPSSLLEHINAATRNTIMGGATTPHSQYEEKGPSTHGHDGETDEQDPFAAGGYVRADTPSDAIHGMLAEEQSRPAHARYSFDGAGEGELQLSAGAEVEVLDDRDPAWWYARDPRSGQEGVVPAAYLY